MSVNIDLAYGTARGSINGARGGGAHGGGARGGDASTPLLLKNEHHPVDGAFKAAIFGFSDGLTTSINLVLGVALTRASRDTVVFTGMAGLFAGASSMACGEWLSAQAEREAHASELRQERRHLQQIPDEEARHMKGILESYGLSAATADAVNRDVAALPLDGQLRFHGRFELGIEPDDASHPLRNAATMWVSFVVGAFVPVAPWMLTPRFDAAIGGSIGGGAAGMVAIALYQVRGGGSGGCGPLLRAVLRQLLVTAVAVGLTVLFDALFARTGY